VTLALGLAAKAIAVGVGTAAVATTAVMLVAPEDAATAPADRPSGTLVTQVVDGDTVEIESGDRVRLIGIDTPEVGQCGYETATVALRSLVEGERVILQNPPGVQDEDVYGRLLRYVDQGETDAGYQLLKVGLAIARYDSQDGYDPHPRESRYRAADKANKATTSRCEEQAQHEEQERRDEWQHATDVADQAHVEPRPGERAAHLLDRARTQLREQHRIHRQQFRQKQRQRERQQERRQEQRQEQRAVNPPDSSGSGYTGCREYAPGGLTWVPIPCP